MKIVDKNSIFEVLRQNKRVFFDFGVKRLGVFGSFVRGEQDEKSDIDVLVEFDKDKKNYKNYMAINDYLEDLFDRKVDVVTKESLSRYIGPYIKKEVEYV